MQCSPRRGCNGASWLSPGTPWGAALKPQTLCDGSGNRGCRFHPTAPHPAQLPGPAFSHPESHCPSGPEALKKATPTLRRWAPNLNPFPHVETLLMFTSPGAPQIHGRTPSGVSPGDQAGSATQGTPVCSQGQGHCPQDPAWDNPPWGGVAPGQPAPPSYPSHFSACPPG